MHQIKMFKTKINDNCVAECKEKLKTSLFVLGPFGSNDYRRALGYGKDIEEITSYVPLVINVISAAINVRSYIITLFIICVHLIYTIIIIIIEKTSDTNIKMQKNIYISFLLYNDELFSNKNFFFKKNVGFD